jgi:hypothetical protein
MDCPIGAVNAALAAGPRKWFPVLDGTNQGDGHSQGVGLRKKITVEVGEAVSSGDRTEIPITWKATFIRRLFPIMTGKVEIAPVASRTTLLTVCAMYELAIGRIGKPLDEALVHRVAEGTVKDLAESIAKRLELSC